MTYEVRRYYKQTVFDSNLNLVWRWYYVESFRFSNAKRALRYFRACNNPHFPREKAVLKVIKKKGGK